MVFPLTASSADYRSDPSNPQHYRRRRSALKATLPGHSHIDKLDSGLVSVHGAQEIISNITCRRLVTKLILGHNDLRDDGCIILFKFLCSAVGKKYKIQEINLNGNNIGDRGMLAIADYLKNNDMLKELFLQNNSFQGSPEVVCAFTSALNSSRLSTLVLTTNRGLSDPFISLFLPSLTTRHLHEIHLSAIGLTSASTEHIISYITSPECRLHTLNANGNSLGLRGVRRIIKAIEKRNWGLLKVEMYLNQLVDGSGSVRSGDDTEENEEADVDSQVHMDKWRNDEKRLKMALWRNGQLKLATERESLVLLRYSRAALLRPAGKKCEEDPPTCTLSQEADLKSFPFQKLPTELQLSILSLHAPTLSPAQRIRIFAYTSTMKTLPRLSRDANVCLPEPGRGPFYRREETRKWLAEMGCDMYEPT